MDNTHRRYEMKIRVLKLGEAATEITMAEGSTVQEAIDALGWLWNGWTVMLNGTTAVGWTQLKDGDVVTMSPRVEGGARVKILKLGEAAKEVDIPEGRTIGEALVMAGFSSEGCSITKNGSAASMITPLSEGDICCLTSKVEGGI